MPLRLGQGLQGGVQRAGHLLDLPVVAERGERLGDRQAVEHPVDGAHPQRVAGGVDQQDQAPVPGAARQVAVLALQPQVHLPAVVPVGDQRATGGQVAGHLGQVRRVGDRPEPVPGAVAGGRGEQRLVPDGALDHLGRLAVAAVRQQQRFEVGPGGPHQADPVGDRPGHHVLVRQHHAGLPAADRQRADQTALQQLAAGGVGMGALLVHVERGLRVGGEDALAAPLLEQPGGVPVAGVAVRAVTAVVGLGPGQDQADDVVRVRRLQVEPAARVDHVVRGRGDRRQGADPVGDVPQAAEGGQGQPCGGDVPGIAGAACRSLGSAVCTGCAHSGHRNGVSAVQRSGGAKLSGHGTGSGVAHE